MNVNIDKIVSGMTTTPPKNPAPNRERLETALERFGFSRAIAGDHDFDKALDAITLARVEGRGLLVTGENGVGKTVLMRAVYDIFHKRCTNPNRQPWEDPTYSHGNCEWIDCNVPEQLQWLTYDCMLESNIFLDDFGAGRMLYGDFDAVGAFICLWYARHKNGCTFNMTSNLDAKQTNDRSGGRVLDRLVELCVAVRLDGNSKRKAMVVK